MIYFKEFFSEDGGVCIQIEGGLDSVAIPALQDLCADHFGKKRKVSLNLAKVDRIDRESLTYLRSIRNQVQLDGLNQYLKMMLDEDDFTE